MLTKKNYFAAAAMFLILVGSLISINAQNKPLKSLYAEPSRLMFPGDEKEDAEFENGRLLREHFFPIGWSNDGKFAYYSEPPDEACDCYFADFLIQDMRNDKVLWTFHFEGKIGGNDSIKTLWRKKRREFSRKLAQYGIVAGNRFDLQSSPLDYRKDALTLKLIQNIEIEDIFAVGDVRVDLLSSQKGSKTIYEQKYKTKDYSSLQSAEIGGVLISPFEARAAVVIVETHRGWEGPPNVTQLNLVGAALTNGFR